MKGQAQPVKRSVSEARGASARAVDPGDGIAPKRPPLLDTHLRAAFTPFNPVRSKIAINSAWLKWNDGIVPRLSSAIYEERSLPDGHLDVTRMGVLADALEDAGCDNEEIIRHCREQTVHVRGCFVIDLILGKS